MNNSATLRFISIAHSLSSLLTDCRFSVASQLENGTSPRTVNFLFRGRLSRWYAENHAQIISSAQSLKTSKSDAISAIGAMTVSAYTSASQRSELTKGKAFDHYLLQLPDALLAIGHDPKIGRDLQRLYESVKAMIEGSSVAASAKPKRANPLAPQIAQANALAEQLLNTLPETERHEARRAVGRADNKLAALKRYIEQGSAHTTI